MTETARLIHTVDSIRRIERAHTHFDPPLMERAGAAATGLAVALRGSQGRVLIACGPGNNGGDGLVTARLLRARGIEVEVRFIGDAERLPPDAAAAMRAWLEAGGRVESAAGEALRPDTALLIDALFGIGLRRALDAPCLQLIAAMNRFPGPRLALDVPTGLDAGTGVAQATSFVATHTLSFIALKPGLLTADGPDHSGEIHVADLGIAAARAEGCGETIAPALFAERLVPRRRNTHKGSYGDVVVIGGARGMVGAALLAGRAALQVGAGRVFVGLVDSAIPAIDPLQPELMVRSAASLAQAPAALAVGPGLGRSTEAIKALTQALQGSAALVLDADALNHIADDAEAAEVLRSREAPAVITPHPAEAARLLGCGTDEVQRDRLAAARALAGKFGRPALLKGSGSLVALPDGRWFANTSGHPGMASAGMGDTLSGLIAGLIAQGWPPAEALIAATHLHGVAADQLASEGVGPIGLTAGETATAARRVLNRWIGDAARRQPA